MGQTQLINTTPEEIRQLLRYVLPQLYQWWGMQPQPYPGSFYIPSNPLQMFAAQLMSNLMGTTYPWFNVGYNKFFVPGSTSMPNFPWRGSQPGSSSSGGGGSGSWGWPGGNWTWPGQEPRKGRPRER